MDMQNPDQKKKPEWLASLWRESLRAMSLGWDLAVPIFGGVLLGHFLDRLLGTGYIFTVGLIFLGIIISYYNLGKFIVRMRKIDQKYLHEHKKDKKEGEEKNKEGQE
jgi:F0F1-type ATP synthase assembly protein I